MQFDLVVRNVTSANAGAIVSAMEKFGASQISIAVEKPAKEPKEVKEKKPKKEDVKQASAKAEADEMFADDELGLDANDDFNNEDEAPVLTLDDAVGALRKFVAKAEKAGKTSDEAKLLAKKLLASYGVKSAKDMSQEQIAALIKKVG